MKLEDIVNGAVGPFDKYCDGYGNPGANGLGYISDCNLHGYKNDIFPTPLPFRE